MALALAAAVLGAGLAVDSGPARAQSGEGLFGAFKQLLEQPKRSREKPGRRGRGREREQEWEWEREPEKEQERETESLTPAKGFASAPTAGQQPYDTTGPVALVESVDNAPMAGVELMDYVYADQAIDLGSGGELVLSYFDSCVRETITGGRVRVGAGQSSVSGGEIATETLTCQGAKQIVTADASEAGGAVKRVTPFKDEEWREFTVKADRPVFKWQPESRGQPVTVTVTYLDAKPLEIVWQDMTSKSYLPYPPDAPRLEAGMPYLVQVTHPSGGRASAQFSIDPWLDVADNAANRLVSIGR